MVEISIAYEGNLRTKATHQPSQTQLVTDAPVDNHGLGESFSPTDLVATALGSCMLTIMGIYAQQQDIDLSGARVQVDKHMSTTPRRIGKLVVNLHLPVAADHPRVEALKKAALSCPVHHSLHPEIEIPVEFHWEGLSSG